MTALCVKTRKHCGEDERSRNGECVKPHNRSVPRIRAREKLKLFFTKGLCMKERLRDFTGTVSEAARQVSDQVVSAGTSGKSLALRVSSAASDTTHAALSKVSDGMATAGSGVVNGAGAVGRAVRIAGVAAAAVGSSVARTATTVGTTLLDQNGDGQLDQEDVRIATEKSAAAVKAVVTEVASSSLAKDAATGAAIGAVLAVPIPFVGPLLGASLGAVVGSIAHLRKTK